MNCMIVSMNLTKHHNRNSILFSNNTVIIALMAVILGFNAVYSYQCIHIHFFDSAKVKNEKIVLGDIARISIESNCEAKSIAGLPELFIGEAAPAGYSRFVDVHTILQTYLRPQFSHISTGGAQRVKVRTDAYFKTVGDYENQIVSYLKKNMHWSEKDVTIIVKNPEKQWRCYKKNFQITFHGITTPYPKGNIQFFMKITQGNWILTIPVHCNIKVTTPVVSVAEQISRNEKIQKKHIRLVSVDITSFKYTPCTSVSSIVGNIAVKTLSPGTIIHTGCIKPVPDICRGDQINIILQKGKIKLSVSGRAREEGMKGDRIWVENIQSHKLMKVIIIGKGLVSPVKGASI